MSGVRWLGRGQRVRWWWRHGFAIVCTAAAALLRWTLDPMLGPTWEYLLFYFAVLLVALLGGTGPGVLATGLGALAGRWLFVHLGHVGASVLDDIARLAVFVPAGVATAILVGRLQRAREGFVAQAQQLSRMTDGLRESEARFRQAEERLQSLAQFPAENPNPVLRIDREGRVLYANQTAAAFLAEEGWDAGGLLPAALLDAIGGVLRDGVMRDVTFVCRRGRILSFDGIVPSGKAYANLYGRDVTEARRADESLRQSERRFRELADAMPQIVWGARPDGHVDYVNLRWQELTGAAPDRIGEDGWLHVVHPDDRARCLTLWQEAVRTGEPFQVEYRLRFHEPGEYRWHLGRALAARDEGGQVARWYGTCTDIHDLRLAQDDLGAARGAAERAQVAAEEASRAKDHFLAVLSHELRTPLTPVLAGVSLLRTHPGLPERVHQYLDVIRRNVALEAQMIDDLLDLTRIARGRVELDRHPIALRTVIERAVEVCRPDIEARQVHFAVHFADPRPCVVDADAARLQQVFWNLIANAVKFTPKGGCIGVRCGVEQGEAVIDVEDSGMGIEPDAVGRIFDAFAQAERPITREFGGLGLGLSISKSLVERHGGSIEARSEGPDKGALFRVRLPLVPAGSGRASGDAEGAPGRPAPADRPRLRILLVEDHGDTADMIAAALALDGHEVRAVGDVATALEAVAGRAFDVLISDLGLPDRSGLDLVRELRARGCALPAIALSGYGQQKDVEQSRAAGFQLHLVKPVAVDALLERIDRLVHPDGA